jgi:hypothetical protein
VIFVVPGMARWRFICIIVMIQRGDCGRSWNPVETVFTVGMVCWGGVQAMAGLATFLCMETGVCVMGGLMVIGVA